MPNLVAYQVTTPIPFLIEMAYESVRIICCHGDDTVTQQGDHSNLEPHPPLMGNQFTQLLDMHKIRFDHE